VIGDYYCKSCAIGSHLGKSHAEFVKQVRELVADEYNVIGEYKKNNSKVKIKHNVCGYLWNVRAGIFLSGARCPKCNGGVKEKNTDYFKKEVYDVVGNEYVVLSEYENTNSKIQMLHVNCGHKYWVSPTHFLDSKRRCPQCFKAHLKNTETYRMEVYELVNDEYEVLGEYKNSKTNILIRHNKCASEYYVAPNNFLRGSRCPKCKESKGEKKIREILQTRNINYVDQYKVKGCLNKRKLPFDFAIFDENSTLMYLIEYDGEQHFRASFGEKSFKITQNNDKIKTEFCKKNRIPLIRIPYWEFDNIEEILLNRQEEYNVSTNSSIIREVKCR
jgi:predicted Zn-ribbon and HTH transcriptional regulator